MVKKQSLTVQITCSFQWNGGGGVSDCARAALTGDTFQRSMWQLAHVLVGQIGFIFSQ